MALPGPGLDSWSLLGVLSFQLLLLLSLPLTTRAGGQGPVPRVKYHAGDGRRDLSFFQLKDLRDFDTLLLSGDGNTLYVGAREAVLALDIQDPGAPKLRNMISWPASERKKSECAIKKKSNETQCFNFIRVLVSFNATHLYACGTYAFSPACTFIVSCLTPSLLAVHDTSSYAHRSPSSVTLGPSGPSGPTAVSFLSLSLPPPKPLISQM